MAALEICERCGAATYTGKRLGVLLDGSLSAERRLCRPCCNEILDAVAAALRPPPVRRTSLTITDVTFRPLA